MTAKWSARGTRVLTYMSPFFSDPTAYSDSTTAFRHNFFQEGVANGYFVQNANGSTYLMYSLSIKFAMLDLTNPAAVEWMKGIIINQSVEEAGSSGWMCDFGEYLPFDAVLHSVSSSVA
jgi:alpha-glucosidase